MNSRSLALIVVVLLLLGGGLVWSLRSNGTRADPLSKAGEPASPAANPTVATPLSRPPEAPKAAERTEIPTFQPPPVVHVDPPPSLRPEIIDPNHSLLVLAEEEVDYKGLKEEQIKSGGTPLPDDQLYQKYAGMSRQDLSDMFQTLQTYLEESEKAVPGKGNTLSAEQIYALRQEVSWLKAHATGR